MSSSEGAEGGEGVENTGILSDGGRGGGKEGGLR